MGDVITWTVTGGSVIFLLGLISAIGSRKHGKVDARHQDIVQKNRVNEPAKKSAMSLAAEGVANGERDFATTVNNSR